jgi:hypothetical protein
LTAGPILIPVPSGETWIIYNFKPVSVTWPLNAVLAVGEKIMFWAPDAAAFRPMAQILQWDSVWNSRLLKPQGDNQLPIVVDGGQTLVLYSADGSGDVMLSWIVVDKAKGFDRFSTGGRDARRRMIFTWSYHVILQTNGTTVEHFLDVSANPPGQTTFPWEDPVGPDRRYHLLQFIQPIVQTLGVAGTMVSMRVIHEGRDILTQPLIATLPASVADLSSVGQQILVTTFPEPYGIDSNEVLQVSYTVTMGGAVPQNITLFAGFLAIEEFLSNDTD